MGGKMEACAECSRSCSSLHRSKLDPYPIVSSFFKIMFGIQFSQLLIVPPRFAKTIMAMEGKNTYFEDSTGQKWEVNLSNVNGSLAFQKGWNEFCVDHAIELGDFVVLHYFKGSHFIVQIFGRSGCEKPMIYSGMNYQNKRTKLADPCDSTDKETPATECLDSFKDASPAVNVTQRKDDLCNVEKSADIGVNVDNVTRQGNTNKRPKVVPATDFLLESFFMTNRNTSSGKEDDRSDLYDLSVFEKPGNRVDTDKMSMLIGNTCSKVCTALQETQIEEASPDVVKYQMTENTFELSNEADWSRKECVVVALPNNRVDMPLNFSMPLDSLTFPNPNEFSALASPFEPPGERMRIVKQEPQPGDVICALNANTLSRDSAVLFGNKGHKAKNKYIGSHSTAIVEYKGNTDMSLKKEAPELCDSSSVPDIKITCLVQQDSEYFLELPKPLPVKIHRQDENLEQNLVLLRDPVGRLWPVVHHLRKGFEVLGSGWKEFRKSNSIQPGDECTFEVENKDEGIIRVQIVSPLSE
ncbi:B3 domain-containing protein Os01g0905400 isoform X2 [Spinacia oleracea]|nr:B3 domain-containing protein Os01g0905400-like isoform X2 [Spinacia oleracea]XP_056683816.1 B3 domain-containing protein Os01g0905400-like isoform X2 [Spinacia oleracea]